MAERRILAEIEVKVKIKNNNLTDDQVLIIQRHASQLLTRAADEQTLTGDDDYMSVKPGQLAIKNWKFLDLKPTPEAQRRLFAETGSDPDPEL